MTSRRDFLKIASLTSAAAIFPFQKSFGKQFTTQYFALNEFIENNPDAVFIFKTNIDVSSNVAAIRQAARNLGSTLFVTKNTATGAYPVSSNISIKPNVTAWSFQVSGQTFDQVFPHVRGAQTDANFVGGIIDSLKGLLIDASNIYLHDGNYSGDQSLDGKWYGDMAQQAGVNLKNLSTGVYNINAHDIQWIDVQNGTWFKRIPYLWPVNSPGSCFINIAKMKSHSMGMTLCSKNQQGTMAQPYIRHCTAWGSTMGDGGVGYVATNDIVTNAFATIQSNYNSHKNSIPRWKTLDDQASAGSTGGLWMETHHARCLDNNATLQPMINMIEAVYGREGPFVVGPTGPGLDGYGIDKMMNMIIFGKNARHVDIIGVYLAGHEPGNFGLFHIAKERGLSLYLNPADVPLYEWKSDGSATLSSLDQFTRTSIPTLYLQQAGEDQFHMVDQTYDYSGSTVVKITKQDAPDAFVIHQNFPNPFNPTTSIQYYIPKSGNVRLEIFDISGQVVDVLVDGYMQAGDHLKVWNSTQRASGTYFYRILYGGFSKTKSMVLMK
jgi:hypothetical protein